MGLPTSQCRGPLVSLRRSNDRQLGSGVGYRTFCLPDRVVLTTGSCIFRVRTRGVFDCRLKGLNGYNYC